MRLIDFFDRGAALWPHRDFLVDDAGRFTYREAHELSAHLPTRKPPVHLVAAPLTHAAGGHVLWLMPVGGTNVIMRRAARRTWSSPAASTSTRARWRK